MKKKVAIVLTVVMLLIVGGGYGIGNYFINYALSPVSNSNERNVDDKEKASSGAEKIIQTNLQEEVKKAKSFEKETTSVQIKNNGLKLNAKYKDNQSHQWVIVIHGYKSNNTNMMPYGMAYSKKGYNVLLPNNRAHGDSEGEYIGMGWLDKDDIEKWIQWIVEKDSKAQIILHGVSMGGATTMMVSGDNVEHVIGYIEDCGYTSVWDIFKSELSKRFSLPSFPVLDLANIVASMKAGYSFKEASSLEQVKKCQKPMLFIHGGKDDFVPTEMVYELYQNAKCEKELYIVDEAGHAESKNYNPDAYWEKVFSFLSSKL